MLSIVTVTVVLRSMTVVSMMTTCFRYEVIHGQDSYLFLFESILLQKVDAGDGDDEKGEKRETAKQQHL